MFTMQERLQRHCAVYFLGLSSLHNGKWWTVNYLQVTAGSPDESEYKRFDFTKK